MLEYERHGRGGEQCSRSSEAIKLEETEQPFWDLKAYFESLYKCVQGMQHYQMFRMAREKPGQVECRRTPSSEPTWLNLIRQPAACDPPTVKSFARVWKIKRLSDPPVNPEKMSDINKKVLPFVPAKYASDSLYLKPTAEMGDQARKTKRARRERVNKAASKKRSHEASADEEQEIADCETQVRCRVSGTRRVSDNLD